jgi:hypothetical protein
MEWLPSRARSKCVRWTGGSACGRHRRTGALRGPRKARRGPPRLADRDQLASLEGAASTRRRRPRCFAIGRHTMNRLWAVAARPGLPIRSTDQRISGLEQAVLDAHPRRENRDAGETRVWQAAIHCGRRAEPGMRSSGAGPLTRPPRRVGRPRPPPRPRAYPGKRRIRCDAFACWSRHSPSRRR